MSCDIHYDFGSLGQELDHGQFDPSRELDNSCFIDMMPQTVLLGQLRYRPAKRPCGHARPAPDMAQVFGQEICLPLKAVAGRRRPYQPRCPLAFQQDG